MKDCCHLIWEHLSYLTYMDPSHQWSGLYREGLFLVGKENKRKGLECMEMGALYTLVVPSIFIIRFRTLEFH